MNKNKQTQNIPAGWENPFRKPSRFPGVPYSEACDQASRIDCMQSFNVEQLCAVLVLPGMQKAVRLAAERRLKKFPITTVHFEDQGQDFIQWDIAEGIVVNCRPFQAAHWFGDRIVSKSLKVGQRIKIKSRHCGSTLTINYPLVKIEKGGAK